LNSNNRPASACAWCWFRSYDMSRRDDPKLRPRRRSTGSGRTVSASGAAKKSSSGKELSAPLREYWFRGRQTHAGRSCSLQQATFHAAGFASYNELDYRRLWAGRNRIAGRKIYSVPPVPPPPGELYSINQITRAPSLVRRVIFFGIIAVLPTELLYVGG